MKEIKLPMTESARSMLEQWGGESPIDVIEWVCQKHGRQALAIQTVIDPENPKMGIFRIRSCECLEEEFAKDANSPLCLAFAPVHMRVVPLSLAKFLGAELIQEEDEIISVLGEILVQKDPKGPLRRIVVGLAHGKKWPDTVSELRKALRVADLWSFGPAVWRRLDEDGELDLSEIEGESRF